MMVFKIKVKKALTAVVPAQRALLYRLLLAVMEFRTKMKRASTVVVPAPRALLYQLPLAVMEFRTKMKRASTAVVPALRALLYRLAVKLVQPAKGIPIAASNARINRRFACNLICNQVRGCQWCVDIEMSRCVKNSMLISLIHLCS